MKKNLFNLFAAASVVAISFANCTPDPCKDIVCQNGGTCAEGICACPSFYEGELCATTTRDTYKGSYILNGSDDATPQNTYSNRAFTVATYGTDSKQMQVASALFNNTPMIITLDKDRNFTGNTSAAPYTYTVSGKYSGGSNMSIVVVEVDATVPAAPVTTKYTLSGKK